MSFVDRLANVFEILFGADQHVGKRGFYLGQFKTVGGVALLVKIDQQVPADLEIHLICDNYGTHKHPTIKAWLAAHPRVHMHFTPTYSSWLNLVERFFGYVTADLLQRCDHRSVQALETDIRKWVKVWNQDPKVFVWTETAEQILGSLGRLMQRISNPGH